MSVMKMIPLLVAGIFTSGVFGDAESIKGGASMPRKELLRPVILPKGGWQNSLTDQVIFYRNDPSKKYKSRYFSEVRNLIRGVQSKFQYYDCLISLFPRFAVSDRVEFVSFPLPYVSVLMTDTDIGYSSSGALNRFAMTFHGGFSGLSIAEETNVTLNFAAGVTTKLLLSDRWWHEQHFRAVYISRYQDLLLKEMVGLQFGDIIAMKIGIVGGMNWWANRVPSTKFYTAGELHLIANLSRWVSIDVSGSGYGDRSTDFRNYYYSGSVGSTLIVQW